MTDATTTFQERMAQGFLSVTLSTAAPRRTATIPEVSQMLQAEKSATVKGVVSVMPEALSSGVRSLTRTAQSQLAALGWPMSKGAGGRVEYLIPVDKISDAYACIGEAKDKIDSLVSETTADWPAFVQKALSDTGELNLPDHAFPYKNASDYAAQFTVQVHTKPLVSGDMTAVLPAGLSEDVVNSITRDNFQYFTDVLDDIRGELADKCEELADKIGGSTKVSKRTFNALMQCVRLADSTAKECCPTINRIVKRVRSDYAALENNAGCLGPNSTSNAAYQPEYTTKYKSMMGQMAAALRAQMTVPPQPS